MSLDGSPQMTGSASTREPSGGATAWATMAHIHLRDQEEIVVDQCPPTHSCFTQLFWLEHDQEASARAHEEPIEQLRDRVCAMEANLETLRTRLAQVADLRDAQGLREDHRALIARLTEMEECASVQTLREFMTKILRLESMVCREHGGIIGEAIRACNRRLDNHRATMDDFHARISIQDWYHDLCDQEDDEEARQSTTRAENRDANAENQSGVENRPPGRRRIRGQAPQRRFQRTMPRPPPPPPPPAQGSSATTTLTPEMIQQGMQRLFVAYNQCVTRVAQIDDRLEQFRSAIRRDALEITLNVQRNSQDLQHQGQSVERIKRTLFDEVQEKVTHLDERIRMVGDQMDGVAKTIDRNEHSKCASIAAMIREQEDIRRLVEELAQRLDQPQEMSSTMQSEFSTAVQLEISDLKAKVLRLTEQSTEQGGKLTFLQACQNRWI